MCIRDSSYTVLSNLSDLQNSIYYLGENCKWYNFSIVFPAISTQKTTKSPFIFKLVFPSQTCVIDTSYLWCHNHLKIALFSVQCKFWKWDNASSLSVGSNKPVSAVPNGMLRDCISLTYVNYVFLVFVIHISTSLFKNLNQ